MYAPNAPPKPDNPPGQGTQLPPYSPYDASKPYAPPVVDQQPGIGFGGYPPAQAQPYPPYPQPYPPPNQPYPQPYPPPNQAYPPPNQQYPPPNQQYPPPNQQYPPPNQPPYGQPVQTQQPMAGQVAAAGGGGWMPSQAQYNNPNCPPGLEYLSAVDQLLVHQKVELLEAFTGFETSNKYTVKNSMGQKVYNAAEISDCCTRQLCGPNRAFDMKIVDNHGNEVIHLNRPLACSSCLFPCCLQNMEVTSPPGTVIGSIQQEWTIFSPKFTIKDASGNAVLTIEGPLCTFSMCGDVEFNVYSRDGSTKVGKISKQWSGFVREAFTDADMFGINFPMDLDVKIKAVLLGACFLIDFMFFEKAGNNEHDRPGML